MTIDECRGLAAQAWCTKENENTVMDTDLAEAFAHILQKQINDTLDNVKQISK